MKNLLVLVLSIFVTFPIHAMNDSIISDSIVVDSLDLDIAVDLDLDEDLDTLEADTIDMPSDTLYVDFDTEIPVVEIDTVISDVVPIEVFKANIDTLHFFQELPFLGLKGRVEKVVQRRYSAMPTKGEYTKRKSRGEDILLFEKMWSLDKNGYPTEFTQTIYNRTNPITIRVEYIYDGADLIQETIYRPGRDIERRVLQRKENANDPTQYKCYNGRDIEVSSILFNDIKKRRVRVKMDLDEKQNIRKTHYVFKNHKVVKEEEYVGTQLNRKTQYKYQDNDLSSITEVIVDSRPVITKYVYPTRDEYKNWTQRILTYYNDVPKFIEEQVVTYRE